MTLAGFWHEEVPQAANAEPACLPWVAAGRLSRSRSLSQGRRERGNQPNSPATATEAERTTKFKANTQSNRNQGCSSGASRLSGGKPAGDARDRRRQSPTPPCPVRRRGGAPDPRARSPTAQAPLCNSNAKLCLRARNALGSRRRASRPLHGASHASLATPRETEPLAHAYSQVNSRASVRCKRDEVGPSPNPACPWSASPTNCSQGLQRPSSEPRRHIMCQRLEKQHLHQPPLGGSNWLVVAGSAKESAC